MVSVERFFIDRNNFKSCRQAAWLSDIGCNKLSGSLFNDATFFLLCYGICSQWSCIDHTMEFSCDQKSGLYSGHYEFFYLLYQWYVWIFKLEKERTHSDQSCKVVFWAFWYFKYSIMYSRHLLQTNPFGWIFDILLPFSCRIHRVRTAKMSLYNKNPSRNISFRKFREYIL